MNPNREFHELVGLCWCEPEYFDTDFDKCPKCGAIYSRGREFTKHPDYAAAPLLVLREMVKREDWPEFLETIGGQITIANKLTAWVFLDYILDTTGKLIGRAIDFLKGKEGKP